MLNSISRARTHKSFLTVLFSVAVLLLSLSGTTRAQEKIVFDSNRDGNDEIYVMNADGSNQVRLTNNAVADGNAAISPDGNKVVFATVFGPGTIHISIMNIDGSGLVQLTTGPSLN